jgi:deoxyribodipyrimidine photolyase
LFFEGKTGVPFLDAALREIAATGYMSNRMRQNVASYFAVDLYIDWRFGAEWFETYLSDYDVCSNWGNWQYQARDVGTDPRAARQFNPLKQANTYDIGDEYVKTWVPELNELDEAYVQTPWCEFLVQADCAFDLSLSSIASFYSTTSGSEEQAQLSQAAHKRITCLEKALSQRWKARKQEPTGNERR